MNKIRNIPLYNHDISLKCNSYEPEQCTCSDNRHTNSNEYMSSDVSSASRAYGLSFINKNKIIPQMSLKDMISWFESQGKIEGKDFEIDSSCRNTVVILKNKQGKEELAIHYDHGNRDEWNFYESSEYKNNKLNKKITRRYNGHIISIMNVYDKNDAAIQHLFDSGLSYDTTPEKYLAYLKKKKIKYNVDYGGEKYNNRNVNIDVLNENNQKVQSVWFEDVKNKSENNNDYMVVQSDMDQQGQEFRRVIFNKNDIEVFTYIDT